MDDLELWGGHEFTVNRLESVYLDQTKLSGHHHRPEDLDLFASLGIQALRYPVLWERVAPERPDRFDWAWTDRRLFRLRDLNVRPIVGLLHHGSGPHYTSLVEPSFAPGLAAFARAAAQRYPWVEDWTPINEPLTTARFSTLYGHWYPHLTDEAFFWLSLLNQIDGVRLAMAEIRKVNPKARLIQTEDLGRSYATGPIATQAEFDNVRRWMTWDLLTGRVVPGHPMWERLDAFGLAERLCMIADDPCPPDIVGVNHYLTSDRFLDHRLTRYPPERWGGNATRPFADVEAVRVVTPQPGGLEEALRGAWERYGIPLAVTESFNGCTREEQIRWLREAWTTSEHLRSRGVAVKAVTAWALLGAFDWNSLLTRPVGHYEVGAFDMRCPEPRPTALAQAIRSLRSRVSHPAWEGDGWWRRDIRLEFEPSFRTVDSPEPRLGRRPAKTSDRPLLILGATGVLGQAIARSCDWRGLAYVLTGRSEVDLAQPASLRSALSRFEPWAVINAAGSVRVDEAETEVEACLLANTEGAAAVSRACQERGIPHVAFSSDLVFDGGLQRPYVESDAPNPMNVYGRSKALAEEQILAIGGQSLIVRTAAFFSPYDPYNFAAHVVDALAAGRSFAAASDLFVSPTYVPDLVDAVLDLLIDGETGIWHLANEGVVSWSAFAMAIAESLGLDAGLVEATPVAAFGWPAQRPARAVLGSERGRIMPPLSNAIARYAAAVSAARYPAELEAEVDRTPARIDPVARLTPG